ncbi:hypothetical protein [Arthrobacter sp. ISL-69]|uniref:hypothetical protein n=1 Tax=Arthrobacter sp. ISL-69 TaxID=2819113 RepID=UPI001BED33CA|nr:hypothetical protein [Arthrobacter sp. ISL-69]MBT2538875.1 hypothetical protein [Arthrobacter sp. ISL-69]
MTRHFQLFLDDATISAHGTDTPGTNCFYGPGVGRCLLQGLHTEFRAGLRRYGVGVRHSLPRMTGPAAGYLTSSSPAVA